MKFKVRYKKGFGHFTQTHKGFGPTIYTEETLEWDSGKDYFDFVDFFKKYYDADDTYFHVKFMDEHALNDAEKESFAKYEKLRDEYCLKARMSYMDENELEPEFINPVGD